MNPPVIDRVGVLLVNLGTPDAPTTGALRPYLRQFLSDPRVIDVNAIGRWLLVNLIIVPFRSPKSAKAYQRVWTADGSPLMLHGLGLTKGIEEALEDVPVALGMRYGNPSIASAVAHLAEKEGCDRIVVLPLFPQYSSAAWGSAVEEVHRVAGERPVVPSIATVPPFFEHPAFIDAQAATMRTAIDEVQPDHVLMSYHGVPERHCTYTDFGQQHCMKKEDCCATLVAANRACYRAQCLASSRALARALDLSPEQWSVSFQSRLPGAPWIKPFTDEVVEELPGKGVKRLVVACPSFTADCLETIEEIGMEARDEFLEAGGEAFALASCVNATEAWVDGCVRLLAENGVPVSGGAASPARSRGSTDGDASQEGASV